MSNSVESLKIAFCASANDLGVSVISAYTPRSLAEAQNAILRLSTEFDKLPTDIKEKFDNSKEKFVQEYGTDEWAEKMGFKAAQAAPKTEEVEFVPGAKEAAEPLTPTDGGNAE